MLGIESDQFPVPGMVLLYEEHSARLKAGYTITEWMALNSYERAMEVALYRIDSAVEYQKNKAQERRMQEQAAQSKAK